MLITILSHTPTWVFGLLLLLVGLGVSQAFPRQLTLRRSAILPLVLVGLSLAGVIGSFGNQAPALLAWAAALAVALALVLPRTKTSGVRFDRSNARFTVPGSWWPLVLMLGLFALKFAVGVTLARVPALRSTLPFALGTSAAYGAFSGIFLGRAAALWRLARQHLQAAPQAA